MMTYGRPTPSQTDLDLDQHRCCNFYLQVHDQTQITGQHPDSNNRNNKPSNMGIVHIVMFAFEPLAPPDEVQKVSGCM